MWDLYWYWAQAPVFHVGVPVVAALGCVLGQELSLCHSAVTRKTLVDVFISALEGLLVVSKTLWFITSWDPYPQEFSCVGVCRITLGGIAKVLIFVCLEKCSKKKRTCNCDDNYDHWFSSEFSTSKEHLLYEFWNDNAALVVLGQHWCALHIRIYECQSVTSFIFGFIFSFSSWVNFEFVEVL